MRHRLLGQAALHGDHAQEMQCPSVPGIACQHRPAERLGIEPLPKLVMAYSFGKQMRGLSGTNSSANSGTARSTASMNALGCGAALFSIHPTLYSDLKIGGEGGIRTHDTG